MRFGCCGNMVSETPDGIGEHIARELVQIGYDYIELPLARLAQLDQEKFDDIKKQLEHFKITCEVCNILFPAWINIFSEADENIEAYLNKAFKRAKSLGAQYVVFGSGPSRMVPEGMSSADAWDRLIAVTKLIGDAAKPYDITIVIEPLRKAECNIINSVRDGLKLAKLVNHENIKLLVDFYHLIIEHEDPQILLETGNYIKHVHLANTNDRVFPKNIEEDQYVPFINALKAINYRERVSVEAYTSEFNADARVSLDFLKKYFL